MQINEEETQLDHTDKVVQITKECDSYLNRTFGIGWNDLADRTSVYDFIDEDFDLSKTKKVEAIVKDICWDKLDLDGTIYMAMSREQMNEAIYGK